MKVTYNWLKEYVNIPLTAEELAEKLTRSGFEVEEICYQNQHLHDVVVGKILKIEKHPQADRLVVCQVDIGDKTTQIITAATNVFEGAVVPVSLPGADLVNGVKIQPTKMRGVESNGMFCSGEELGIDENYFEGAGVNGILILPSDMKIGEPIEKALSLDDVVLDVYITPNRPDCLSVIGLAREIGAILGDKPKKVNLSYPIDIYSKDTVHDYIEVDNQTENCPRYCMGAVKDVKIERSPLWMRARLNAVGIKPINTIVDITNYVLVEMGQPLHAFDQALIDGKQINVRQAKEGEKIEALNGVTYNLDGKDIVIADKDKPMVIAGIIGGTNSCINDNTKTVVLESAVFDLKSVRSSSRKYGIRTDSSARNEKGINLASAEDGLLRALALVSKLKCGKVVRGIIDKARGENKARQLVGSVKFINQILGIEIPAPVMSKILNNLGIENKVNGDRLECIIPPYRQDIENNNDLAEEIIRLYGYDVYDKTDGVLFKNSPVTESVPNVRYNLERKYRNMLVQEGFYEIMTFTFGSNDFVKRLMLSDERANPIKISNPLGENFAYMRTTMLSSMLQTATYNLSVGNKEMRLFECGKVYLSKGDNLKDLANEPNMLAMLVSEDGFDFFDFKNVIENLLGAYGEVKLERSKEPYLHPGISADIFVAGQKVGHFGKLHPSVIRNYELPANSYYGEICTSLLISLSEKKIELKQVSKFPNVARDLAVVVDEEVEAGDMVDAIKSACGNLYFDCSLFDVYRSDALGKGKKSLAFNIILSDLNKTLTDEEIARVMNKVLKALSYRFGAVLR